MRCIKKGEKMKIKMEQCSLNIMRTGYIAAAILFMCLLITQNAYAADLFTVPDTDKSKLWFLDVLFPENLAQSPLASTMTILNSAILLVGGILAAYTANSRNDVNGA